MTIQEIATRLVELCRAGQYSQAHDELFADEAMSIEPVSSPAPTVDGLTAIKEKTANFQARIQEMHSSSTSDPLVADSYISLVGSIDATMTDGSRMTLNEICLYKVENGKIISEQFFY